nr:type III-B CRISPR module RAMP protein Cmr4 [uncultured Methanoregula sp.]
MTTSTMKNAKMYWIQAITPLHVGAGKGVGFIDMPIMREKVTTWPIVPGSAVKGVLRDHFKTAMKKETNLIDAAFGKAGLDVESNAGALVLTDAHIVCMPVRSLYGTFAYVTSPMVLERLKRDLAVTGYTGLPDTPTSSDKEAYCPVKSVINDGEKIFLEDLDLSAKPDGERTGKWAEKLSAILFTDPTWQAIFKERFVIVSDNCFNFLAEHGTDIAARVRINDERKIVEKGALWYEESLPSEAILAGIAWCDRIYGGKEITPEKIFAECCTSDLDLQIGGKANVGKGRVRCRFTQG